MLADSSQLEHYGSAVHSINSFCQAYRIFADHLGAGSEDRDSLATLGNLTAKRIALLPLHFEALTTQLLTTMTSPPDRNIIVQLSEIIYQSQELGADADTYALYADCVLTSASSLLASNNTSLTTRLPLAVAASLLSQIIAATRNLAEYDVVRASRWIRCLVQVCLAEYQQQGGRWRSCQLKDASDGEQLRSSDDTQEDPLTVVDKVVQQGASLVQQTLRQYEAHCHASISDREAPVMALYPAEELEWLSTTLFNVGIDFYVNSHVPEDELKDYTNGIGAHDDMSTPASGEAQIKYGHADDNIDSGSPAADRVYCRSRKWILLAIELAGLLAEYESIATVDGCGRKGSGQYEPSSLLGILKQKVSEGLGWKI